MKYFEIEGLSKMCSQLIMGSGDFTRIGETEAFRFLDAFIACGGNLIDTAHQYRNSERWIGQWLKSRDREQVVIMTKCAHDDDGSPGKRVNPQAITQDLTESLERLQTDYIDLFALHRDDPNVEAGLIVETMNEHIAAGKIKAIGCSNWSLERIDEANRYAKEHNLRGFTFNSVNLSLAKPQEAPWPGVVSADAGMIEWHKAAQIPLLSWSSQAGGFFSGRFNPENTDNAEMVRVYYNAKNWGRLHRAEELGKAKKATAIQIALAYVLNQAFPTGAIIGPRSMEELQSSVEGEVIELSPEQIAWLQDGDE